MIIQPDQITGFILAGGKASRMKFVEKPLLELGGKPIIQRVLSETFPHVRQIIINSNKNKRKYKKFGCAIIPDEAHSHAGPLIGILSGLNFISKDKSHQSPPYLLCLPGDVPFFPKQLISRLIVEMSKKPCDVVLAKSNNQLQPLFSLWSLASQKKVNEGVVERGLRGPRQVMSYLNYKVISIDSESPLEFLNINEESDLMFAKKLLAARKT
ncbi:MAG: molybdenum cofactor guanylyltransferase [Gammaproteobacteria bacterium]|nr:molybdenum cofactor guanylyltransferase [Gammaproteobacteria bacterium]